MKAFSIAAGTMAGIYLGAVLAIRFAMKDFRL